VTKRLMMYALNREIEYYDMPQIRKIVHDAAAKNYTLGALVTGIVNSDSFRRQGPEGQASKGPQTKVAANDAQGIGAVKQLQER
jgi:cytochrome c-type biogenesis protein CcmE